jgi:type II secretory pathway pseudopilin PulG
MKRMHKIEAGIAAIVIVILFVYMLPSFQRVQVKSQPEALQLYVENVVQHLARWNNYKKVSSVRGIHSSGFSNNFDGNDLTKIRMRFKEENSFFEKENFIAAFDMYPEVNWNISDVSFLVTRMYALKPSSNSSISQNDFEEKPSIISVLATVGFRDKNTFDHAAPFFVHDDKEGYLKVSPSFVIPYSMTNGVESFGCFYADTTSIWPRKKAVVFDPPILRSP